MSVSKEQDLVNASINMNKEVLKLALKTWGEEEQQDMIIEECSELIHGICKLKRLQRRGATIDKLAPILDKICEEMADVKILFMQFETDEYYADSIRKWAKMKMERLVGRLHDEKKSDLQKQREDNRRNNIVHGENCEKRTHYKDGYRIEGMLHAPDDDSPYDVDGWVYCGRCHHAL